MPTTRPSLLHHPVVAVSFLVMVAAAAQMAVWSLQAALPPVITLPFSSAIMHGWLFEQFQHLLEHSIHNAALTQKLLFLTGISAGLISGIAWYFAARFAQRPIAAWVIGILWFAHPGVALLIQRQSALMVMIAFAAVFWALLIAWHRRRHYALAMGAGLACGALTLMSFLGPFFLVVALASVLFSSGSRRRNANAAGELLLSWAVLVVPAYHTLLRSEGFDPMVKHLRSDLWAELDSGEKTQVAQDALHWRSEYPEQPAPRPLVFLVHEFAAQPKALLGWLAHRAWRALYATDDGSFARPMLVSQIVILLPAGWAILISLGRADRRWLTFTGLALVLITWSVAALAEPLARNLLPVGGIVLLLACIGLADGRERLYRLMDRLSASHRSGRNMNAPRRSEGGPF